MFDQWGSENTQSANQFAGQAGTQNQGNCITGRSTTRVLRPAGGQSTIGNLMNPTDGFRGAQAAKGIKPKDHVRENYAKMKQVQAENREKKAMQADVMSQKQKPGAYSAVQSRVSALAVAEPEQKKEFMKRGVAEQRQANQSDRQNAKWEAGKLPGTEYEPMSRDLRNRAQRPAVPRATDCAPVPQREAAADFITKNRSKAAKQAPVPAARRQSAADPKHKSFGQVPAYLNNVKKEVQNEKRAVEEMVRAQQPGNCPPGMRLMPEDERLEMLRTLKESMKEGNDQLDRMPLNITTKKAIDKKRALEKKLEEIQDALKMFSKKEIFIQG